MIYLIAIGATDNRFHKCIRWCVYSLRKWGQYGDEILVLTDQSNPDLTAQIGKYADIQVMDATQLIEVNYEKDSFEKFFVARLFIDQLIDLSAYKTVMYLDADILAVNDINPLFEKVNEFQYSREFQPMSLPSFSDVMTESELEKAKLLRGINSGIYVAPAHYLATCLKEWKILIDANPNAFCYDQTALNAAIIRGKFKSKPLHGLSVGYPALAFFESHFRPQMQLLHYCGNRLKKFERMKLHFESLQKGEPLLTSFEQKGEAMVDAKVGVDHKKWKIALDDWTRIESHALVNNQYRQHLTARGHEVISLDEAEQGGILPDVVIHHNYTVDFMSNTFVKGVPHIAIRTSDFGPYPKQWVERINRNYQQLWVHSEWTKQNALDGGIANKLIKIIPHGIDPTNYTPKGDIYQLPTKKQFRFLFVGGAAVRKGIDTLLKAYCEAFTKDDDVCLVIKDSSGNVFYKDDQYRNQILAIKNDLDKPEIVHIDDHLSISELTSLYRSCSIGVWPYRGEGFLIPALESLACGTPTMLPDIGPTKDFSNERTSFLVPAIDVRLPIHRSFKMRLGFDIDVKSIRISEIKADILSKHMKDAYLSHEETLNRKRASGLTMAHGRFTWSHALDKVEEALDEVIEAKERGR